MHLNAEQKRAVETSEGRLLILAGAGTGKTRVIVHRIVHLIKKKSVSPDAILGLTFTNKAAAEMRERIAQLLSPTLAKRIVLCTFHSFCMKVLRKEIHHLGYTRQFSLYDESDVKRMLKQISREENEETIDEVVREIVQSKTRGDVPSGSVAQSFYNRLQTSMRAFNAVDFDSLLSLTVELFTKYPEVLKKYQRQFQYLMIDEYQDTNPIQHKIAELLSKEHNNLCVVGDDYQCIYGWRGAELKNILLFESSQVIKLQQNYRSLPTILHAANALIANNSEKHNKELYSKDPEKRPIVLFHAPTQNDEAQCVVQRILHLRQLHNLRWRDFAILYRSNAIARTFEMALLQGMWKKQDGSWARGIPYRVFGGLELSKRSEVKDLIAYLRLIANPKDEEALLRIINIPRRGISDKTLSILTEENRKKGIPLWEMLTHLKTHPSLHERAIRAVCNFVCMIEEAREKFAKGSLKEALSWFVDRIGYQKAIEDEVKSEQMRLFKWENIQNCILAIEAYEQEQANSSLQDFLSSTLLDANRFTGKNIDKVEDKVHVMTFHSAKGLEFEACFLVALEDHIIPHEKSHTLEEERRLMYVAITRAKKHLTLSMAKKRPRYGKETESSPSRFIFEIPKDLLRIVSWRNPF